MTLPSLQRGGNGFVHRHHRGLNSLPRIQTALIVGKGPSSEALRYVTPSPDAFFYCNEAWKILDDMPPGAHYMCRADSPRTDMDWCRSGELPNGVIPIIHNGLRHLYPHAVVFGRWPDIGLADRACTAVVAISIAATLGATSIAMIGFDRLTQGDDTYHEDARNVRNVMHGCPDQRSQFARLAPKAMGASWTIDQSRPLSDWVAGIAPAPGPSHRKVPRGRGGACHLRPPDDRPRRSRGRQSPTAVPWGVPSPTAGQPTPGGWDGGGSPNPD